MDDINLIDRFRVLISPGVVFLSLELFLCPDERALCVDEVTRDEGSVKLSKKACVNFARCYDLRLSYFHGLQLRSCDGSEAAQHFLFSFQFLLCSLSRVVLF